ncbi:Pleiotropic drug resistance protein 1 [Glycine soja]|nr:Pleiotropic drug resistance protein 1 [Glycine soja]
MQGGGSFRIGSSSIWRDSDANIFSNSFHQEDDEEALKWAAIQKLPTVARLRKALLTSSEGEVYEIDVQKLGLQERRTLLERLRALPTFTNFMIHIVEGLLNSLRILQSRRQHINILQDVSGIINPGRMTLLLGPPSSGKTTLLLALAAKLDPKLKFSGKVIYNGHGMDEFVPQKTAAYANQNDLHVAELTVRETLAFSARVQGVGTRYDLLAELSRREKETNIKPNQDIDVYMKALANEGQKANLMTDYVLRILGLEVCADTIVGNAMLRGISGGQRKHVTTGEMLVGPANALFMDEISTGIAVISLLQPAPETYNLFDDIILLSDSHIVYQGPREYVLQFFESIGFKCPERKGVADFLQEVTSSKDQEQYWADKDQPYRLPNSKQPLGVEVLKSRGFFTQSYWYWIAVGALIGYTLLFNFGYILALKYLSPPGKHRAVISEEPQSNEQNGGSNKGSNVMRHIKYSYTQRSNSVRNSESGSTSSQTFPARQRGMVLPFEPYSITFDEVTYAVDMPQEMRNRGVAEENLVLLKGVSGTFRSGVLTALMGITGTGKTTLMDVLAGRKTGGYVGGNIKISGYRKKQETFARISGYCEQNDIHSPHVTVYESLLYSSWLRLSPDINVETRKIFIEEVMQLVELKPLRHALVGLPGVNGISTEQRKRLTIAVELVENPSIIFMDEPTPGLDARAAAVVMRTVRNTVDTGRTVVCTIHQPSIDIFESFDEVKKTEPL